MKTFLKITLFAMAVYTGIKALITGNLKHFKISDFGVWWPFLSVGVLHNLDQFRENLGRPVIISPSPGSIYRPGDAGDHGKGNAVDIMLPEGPDLKAAFDVAVKSGFNSVGIYPHWKPYKGLHLGIRPGDQLYKWAGILVDGQQVYVGLDEGLKYV